MDYSHGVVHTPQSARSSPKWGAKDLDNCSFVRIYWVDLVNIRRCRVVTIEYFKALLQSNRPGVNMTKTCLGLVYLMAAAGFSPIGEYIYTLDMSTLKPCSFTPGHMSVVGQFEEKTPVQLPDGSLSLQVGLCPRTLLKRILKQIKSRGTEFLVGFETEFILLRSTDPVEPSNIHDWSASVGFLAGSTESVVLEEIANAIRQSGIPLEMYHPEAAPGQYEVIPTADALVWTREIIVQVAAKHGLHATFAPRPFMDSTGSSAHAHISVHSPNIEKTADKLSENESSFLAGILDHLPAITAFTLPTSASYKRMVDGAWSGGTYVCWGTENREAPIRLTNATSPASRNFELRFIDGTANPHLALAAVFAGGLLGIQSSMQLSLKDCVAKSAAEMTEPERLASGITKRMPLNVGDARQRLEQDSAIVEVLGKDLVNSYLAVNKASTSSASYFRPLSMFQTLEAALEQEETAAESLTRLVKFY
ncbi:hypothetical protein FB45DRAFT_1077651 [Roridomyces roridus]|uniref:Glutamine synthetase n=1 Tax=Roridomyces roridus TaxID=1738132 RepID=A0AAD7FYT9_9AGAR|nr:hypothetical protein FB45DRAFT_1077651 [Roridomyces roridus]